MNYFKFLKNILEAGGINMTHKCIPGWLDDFDKELNLEQLINSKEYLANTDGEELKEKILEIRHDLVPAINYSLKAFEKEIKK